MNSIVSRSDDLFRSLLMGAAHPLKGDKNVMIAVNVIRRAQSAKWFGNGYHQRGGVFKSFAMHHYVLDLMEVGDDPMDGIPKDDAEYEEIIVDYERECREEGNGLGCMMTSARRSIHVAK